MSADSSTGVSAEEAFNVYRLKANPTWVRFGPRVALTKEVSNTTASSFSASTRQTASTYRGASAGISPDTSQVDKGSRRRSHCDEMSPHLSLAFPDASFRREEAEALVAAGTEAALRHERHLMQQRGRQSAQRATRASVSAASSIVNPSRSIDCTSCASYASGHDARSTCPSEAMIASSYQGIRPSGRFTNFGSSSFLRDCTNLAAEHRGIKVARNDAHASRASVGGAHRSDIQESSTHSLCEPGSTAQTETPRHSHISLTITPSSVSRAAATHLSGPAAFVHVEGPMDSLYVPLRRPAPQNCEATRQHFNIFETANSAHVGPRRGSGATRAPVQACAVQSQHEALSTARLERGCVPAPDAYQTSNNLYGQGC
ncbi:hypothetical protein ABL78_4039 [Leptomonas seymouri]|uniref:Uncharacterized protein n=1 Tax=Leptomonas seymouri TaxID=5684 RepID=A0A0N1I411_LEPSE|nr:hypothetical protein ABL78_4039 [Leptomonas seymouri]|eukprot:KPI86905.1 hypothetical protein ABL78_4039 [Leptomonas seymouri]